MTEEYTYDIFGRVKGSLSEVGNPYYFTGRSYDDETGLYYYRARMYSPKVGRFLQTDPVGYYAGMNLYTYVDNNPINNTDPLGLCKTGAPGGVFPGGRWPPKVPKATPESPKAEEKPKENIPSDPIPKDPTPKETTPKEGDKKSDWQRGWETFKKIFKEKFENIEPVKDNSLEEHLRVLREAIDRLGPWMK